MVALMPLQGAELAAAQPAIDLAIALG